MNLFSHFTGKKMNWYFGLIATIFSLSLQSQVVDKNQSPSLAEHVPGELVVRLKSGSSLASLRSFIDVTSVETISQSIGEFALVKVASRHALEDVIAKLNKHPDVLYAEPNFIYRAIGKKDYDVSPYVTAPNDEKFGKLWGLVNLGNNDPNSTDPGVVGADVDALRAWDLSQGDTQIKIAVIDTGVDYNHPDLMSNAWINSAEKNGTTGVDDDGNGFIDDIYGYDFAYNDANPMDGHNHGTHVAGTIGAIHNNSLGVAGMMANVSIVAVKFLDDNGSGSLDNAIKAIDYATKLNVDLMSNSWGGGGFSQGLKDAIQAASDAGILFIAAAGNSSVDNDTATAYPANYEVPNVISVASHTSKDALSNFSSYGKNKVHIAAPGSNILSTAKAGTYAVFSGTSMATPHVSGALGLLLAMEGRLPHAEVIDRLLYTSVPVKAYRGKVKTAGRLNAYHLLASIRPNRDEPKPEDWVRVELPQSWESKHPYDNNWSEEKSFIHTGAKFVRLVIEKLDSEAKYDFFTLLDKSGTELEKLSGVKNNYQTEYAEGEKIVAKFTSDRSVNRWGFKVVAYEYVP
jgi:thermitase